MSSPVPVNRPRSPGRSIGSFAWALSPALSLGFLTPITFLIAAVKKRTFGDFAGFAGYSALWAFYIGVTPETAADDIGLTLFMLGSWLGGSVHALLVRRRVWFTGITSAPTAGPAGSLGAAPPPLSHDPAVRPAHRSVYESAPHLQSDFQAAQAHTPEQTGDVLAVAKRQRAEARRIAVSDPMMAKKLRIGRPDLGEYEDGGLVDINHAPAAVIAELPGLSERSAEQIRDRVAAIGPFQSVGELLLEIEMDALYLPQLEEYAVFIP